MDTANSGSLPSSSDGGDDQEYDSISTFYNHNSTSSPLPFDTNSLLNFDPIYTTSQSHPPPPPVMSLSQYNSNTVTSTTNTTTTTPTPQRTFTYPDHLLQPRPNPKKKRSRASRRAPTTVLTTDTNNFRAMVQEFTGIPFPPPPFTTSSNPLHLFATPSSSTSIRSNPFLLRPFAHKFHVQPPLLSTNSTSPGYHVQNPVPSMGFDGFGLGNGLQNRENLFTETDERISMGWTGAGVGLGPGPGPISGNESQLSLVNGSHDYSSHGSGDNGNGNLVNFAPSTSDFSAGKICGTGTR